MEKNFKSVQLKSGAFVSRGIVFSPVEGRESDIKALRKNGYTSDGVAKPVITVAAPWLIAGIVGAFLMWVLYVITGVSMFYTGIGFLAAGASAAVYNVLKSHEAQTAFVLAKKHKLTKQEMAFLNKAYANTGFKRQSLLQVFADHKALNRSNPFSEPSGTPRHLIDLIISVHEAFNKLFEYDVFGTHYSDKRFLVDLRAAVNSNLYRIFMKLPKTRSEILEVEGKMKVFMKHLEDAVSAYHKSGYFHLTNKMRDLLSQLEGFNFNPTASVLTMKVEFGGTEEIENKENGSGVRSLRESELAVSKIKLAVGDLRTDICWVIENPAFFDNNSAASDNFFKLLSDWDNAGVNGNAEDKSELSKNIEEAFVDAKKRSEKLGIGYLHGESKTKMAQASKMAHKAVSTDSANERAALMSKVSKILSETMSVMIPVETKIEIESYVKGEISST